MDYDIIIAQRAYSSWSLRGWLVFDAFDIPVNVTSTRMYTEDFTKDLAAFGPASTVPALRLGDDFLCLDSLAIAEEIAQRHPDKTMWPRDPARRGKARSVAAIMHSGFMALRTQCPMNLRAAYQETEVDEKLQQDLDRLWQVWD